MVEVNYADFLLLLSYTHANIGFKQVQKHSVATGINWMILFQMIGEINLQFSGPVYELLFKFTSEQISGWSKKLEFRVHRSLFRTCLRSKNNAESHCINVVFI